MSSRVVLGVLHVEVVLQDGEAQVEATQDVPLLHGVPVIGKALPAREVIPLFGVQNIEGGLSGAVAKVHSLVDDLKSHFTK